MPFGAPECDTAQKLKAKEAPQLWCATAVRKCLAVRKAKHKTKIVFVFGPASAPSF